MINRTNRVESTADRRHFLKAGAGLGAVLMGTSVSAHGLADNQPGHTTNAGQFKCGIHAETLRTTSGILSQFSGRMGWHKAFSPTVK